MEATSAREAPNLFPDEVLAPWNLLGTDENREEQWKISTL